MHRALALFLFCTSAFSQSRTIEVAQDFDYPFNSPIAAAEFAAIDLEPIASKQNPVTILIHPGIYWTSGGVDALNLRDGIHVCGIDRHSVILQSVYINVNSWACDSSVSNITLKASSPLYAQSLLQVSGTLQSNSSVAFENVDFISTVPFAETMSGGIVSACVVMEDSNKNLNLSFKDCTYRGKSMFLFLGHPSVGSRATNIEVLIDGCDFYGSPSGYGPDDPHVLICDSLPGTIDIRNSKLKWDMTASTRGTNWDRGVILMASVAGNQYTGNQRLEILNSKLEMINNGLGWRSPACAVISSEPGLNRCSALIENTILRLGAYTEYAIVTWNACSVQYSQCNPFQWQSTGTAATFTNLDAAPAMLAPGAAVIKDKAGKVLFRR